jgi:hypothetical protein
VLEGGGSERFLMFPKIIGKKRVSIVYNLWQCGSAFELLKLDGNPAYGQADRGGDILEARLHDLHNVRAVWKGRSTRVFISTQFESGLPSDVDPAPDRPHLLMDPDRPHLLMDPDRQHLLMDPDRKHWIKDTDRHYFLMGPDTQICSWTRFANPCWGIRIGDTCSWIEIRNTCL